MSPKQLQNLRDLYGKTIAAAEWTGTDGISGGMTDEIVIRFTDDTFALLKTEAPYSCDEEPQIYLGNDPASTWARLAAGLITQEQHDADIAEIRLREERDERARYERLKAKFEPGKTS